MEPGRARPPSPGTRPQPNRGEENQETLIYYGVGDVLANADGMVTLPAPGSVWWLEGDWSYHLGGETLRLPADGRALLISDPDKPSLFYYDADGNKVAEDVADGAEGLPFEVAGYPLALEPGTSFSGWKDNFGRTYQPGDECWTSDLQAVVTS